MHPYSLNVLTTLPLTLQEIPPFFHEEVPQNNFSCRGKFKAITYLNFIFPYLSDLIFISFSIFFIIYQSHWSFCVSYAIISYILNIEFHFEAYI